ncbi:hypothetical protein DDZ14_08435 [Maritimibacter sp. 55A14]|uniref:hypothetical protein n=1 Tax=Maritimibacter sp. 55A14 TaxID=2174844 RepID=UPI000D6214FF|nr:hypothetical protein [Maritimibacter sp. 55A14]PWE32764.1 hypothetical protein DDZ14_08435 [Maritimibacter sp. 55A14]
METMHAMRARQARERWELICEAVRATGSVYAAAEAISLDAGVFYREMRKMGVTADEIMAGGDQSRGGDMGKVTSRLTDAEIEAARERLSGLIADGHSRRDLEHAMGWTRTVVDRALRHLGLSTRRSAVDWRPFLEDAAARGLSATALSEESGVDFAAICNASSRFKIKLPRARTRRVKGRRLPDQAFVDAAARGLSMTEAAREIGCMRSTVRSRGRVLGLEFAAQRVGQAARHEDKEFIDAAPRAGNWADMARIVGCAVTTAARRGRALGLEPGASAPPAKSHKRPSMQRSLPRCARRAAKTKPPVATAPAPMRIIAPVFANGARVTPQVEEACGHRMYREAMKERKARRAHA